MNDADLHTSGGTPVKETKAPVPRPVYWLSAPEPVSRMILIKTYGPAAAREPGNPVPSIAEVQPLAQCESVIEI